MRRTLVLAVTLAGAIAHAHVAPSVDDNNRYLKITPYRDRVRIAYTVFFGEVPGAQLRPALDRDRDGQISDAEAKAFGDKIAGEVAGALDLEVDAKQQRIAWTDVSVGLGMPTVKAGAFSVDLVAYACLGSEDGRHVVALRDRFRVPKPGETELKVEDSPGVRVEHARIGRAQVPGHDFKFVGPGGPLSDDGLDLAFVVTDQAPHGQSPCGVSRSAPSKPLPTGIVVGAAAVLGFVLAAVVTLVRRRRARRG